jgi:hypothetical protein
MGTPAIRNNLVDPVASLGGSGMKCCCRLRRNTFGARRHESRHNPLQTASFLTKPLLKNRNHRVINRSLSWGPSSIPANIQKVKLPLAIGTETSLQTPARLKTRFAWSHDPSTAFRDRIASDRLPRPSSSVWLIALVFLQFPFKFARLQFSFSRRH